MSRVVAALAFSSVLLLSGCGTPADPAEDKKVEEFLPSATTDAPATTQVPPTDPPATDAPPTDPPATDAPPTDPPATDAPPTDPPATEAPATEAPATEAPTTPEPVVERQMESCQILEPTIPGYTPGIGSAPRILLGVDVWSPFVFVDEADPSELSGIVIDFIDIMKQTCTDVDVEWTHTQWSKCFNEDGGSFVGDDTKTGAVHACAGYTHLKGVRQRIFEFSHAITSAKANPAGMITRLDSDGKPVIDPLRTNFTGVKYVDVQGWAPTADNLVFAENHCPDADSDKFILKGMVFVESATTLANKDAMAKLKSGEADIMWVYADQAASCMKLLADNGGTLPDDNDCSNWGGLGTEYAYIHSGLHLSPNGTTISMAKRGSGVSEFLNPCIKEALGTQHYYDMCVKYKIEDSCFRNSHFPSTDTSPPIYDIPHEDRLDDTSFSCSMGYCGCSER